MNYNFYTIEQMALQMRNDRYQEAARHQLWSTQRRSWLGILRAGKTAK